MLEDINKLATRPAVFDDIISDMIDGGLCPAGYDFPNCYRCPGKYAKDGLCDYPYIGNKIVYQGG